MMKMRIMKVFTTICLMSVLLAGMTVNAIASGGEVRLSTEVGGQYVEIYFPAGSEAAIAYNRDVKPLLPSRGRMSDAAIAAMEAWKNKYATSQASTGQKTTPAQPSTPANPATPANTATALTAEELRAYTDTMFEIVNRERENAGLTLLVRDAEMDRGAMIRAEELSRHYAHTRPDGTRFFTVMGVKKNYNYAENGGGRQNPETQVQSWMESDGHRANILDANNKGYTKIGIGVYQADDGKMYWCTLFYRPI